MPSDLEIENILNTSGTCGFTNLGNITKTKFNLCFTRYGMNFNYGEIGQPLGE
jgi:hypothetical protein